MQEAKSLLLLFVFVTTLITSCNSTIPVVTPVQIPVVSKEVTKEITDIPTATFPVSREPIVTKTPALTATTTPTFTPKPINEPALISMFGDENHSTYSRIVFSPDGLILAQANSSVKLWDAKTHQLIRELNFLYPGYATNVSFSPDGSFLAVNISTYLYADGSPDGHLLVWNVSTGELKQDWAQEHATMSTYNGFDSKPTVYKIPVNAMAFFPSSTRLAYANGNKIEIKDVRGEGESIIWSLGDKMYASEIGIRGDSEFLYILMKWYKDLTFPALYRWKFRVEVWHPNTKSFRSEIKFEEIDPNNANKWLVGQYLLQQDDVNNTFDALNLSTDKNKKIPYRIGWKHFNSDASLMLVVRYIGVDSDKEGLEIWNTDNWKNPYTFKPNFIDNWFMLNDVAFSPDKTILALDYNGKISLWNVSSLAKP